MSTYVENQNISLQNKFKIWNIDDKNTREWR